MKWLGRIIRRKKPKPLRGTSKTRTTVSGTIIRADGTVEELGILSRTEE